MIHIVDYDPKPVLGISIRVTWIFLVERHSAGLQKMFQGTILTELGRIIICMYVLKIAVSWHGT